MGYEQNNKIDPKHLKSHNHNPLCFGILFILFAFQTFCCYGAQSRKKAAFVAYILKSDYFAMKSEQDV